MIDLQIGHTFPNGTRVLEVLDAKNKYRLTTKFIGYTERGEFIIATLFEGDSYGWTTYSDSLSGVIDTHRYKNRVDNTEAHIERLDEALAEAIDCIEGDEYLTFEQEEVLELAHELRGVINA